MHKLSRSLFAGFVAMGTLVACDDVETTPPAPQVTAVNVVPQNVQLSVGGTATLAATVVGDPGLTDRTVTWRSSNTAVATVDASGTVRGVAAGQTTIIATSNADPNVQGAAAVVVTPLSVPAISIASITKGGVPVDINNVQGQVDVTLNVAGNNAAVSGVQLLVKCPNNATAELVQSQTFSGNVAPNAPITLSFNSAALNATNSGPRFTNGACQVTARLVTPAGQPTAEDAVLPITLQNQDVIIAAVSTSKGPAADQNGVAFRGGDVTVRVTPVLYSGQTATTVTVSLNGVDNDGTVFSKTQTDVAGPFPKDIVFPNTGSGQTQGTGTNVNGWTVENVQVTATAANAQNIVITPTGTQTTTFNLDNEAPGNASYVFNTQSTQNNWIGNAFLFNTTSGNGYTAAVTAPGGNDWSGVDRVTVVFQAAPNNTNDRSCTSSGVTGFTTVTGGTSLNSSPVNGVLPNGQSYCLQIIETDQLGNADTVRIATSFGVDRENPRFVRMGAGSEANNVSFDRNGADEIPTDAFPVGGTVADAATAFWAFTLRDTLSGFDATPVNYSLTRLDAAGTACVVGTGTSCSPTDGANQVVVVDSIDRTVRIPVSNGTTTEGYYTFNGTFRDQAANAGASALTTMRALVDNTEPQVTRTGLPGTLITGNTTANFNFDATDNLDLYQAYAVLAYPVATIRSGSTTIGTPFDATLTRSLTNQTVGFANFYRSLTNVCGVGSKPSTITVRVFDAATNSNVAAPRTIDPQDVQNSTFDFCAASVGLQQFVVVSAVSADESSPDCVEGEICTVTVRAIGASGTFENPFAGVNLYITDNVTGEKVLLNAQPNTTGAQTDNGVNRFYTYTFTFTTPETGPVNLNAIGFTSAGDAFMSPNFAVNVLPAP